MKRSSIKATFTAGLALLVVAVIGADASAVVVAVQDFDANNDALPGSFDPGTDNQLLIPGDFWGVGSRNAWPQGFPSPGVPFSIADDTVFGYANDAPFANDDEGIFGGNSDLDNNYFAMADSDDLGAGQTATWSFNVSGFTDLGVSIDIGSDIDGDFPYDPGSFIAFSASIDAGPSQVLFAFVPGPNPLAPGSLRPLDGGSNEDPLNLLFGAGDATITKLFADGGSSTAASDLYLDKSLVSDGSLDTYSTTVAGTGNILTLTLIANMPFEAAVFDNITITGVPEPATMALLVVGAGLVLRRRR